MRGLVGTRIAVVGAAPGQIGGAIVERLAEEGVEVAIGDVRPEAADALAATVAARGGVAFADAIDIADEDSVARFFARARDALGPIDGLVCNAALLEETIADRDALEIELPAFDRLMAVNLRGHLLCCRAVLPDMLGRAGGAIVLTSSINGIRGEPTRVAYGCAKAGLLSLVRHVAARWGKHGIRCNAVTPGKIVTAAAPTSDAPIEAEFLRDVAAPRLGDPADVGGAVAYLLSQDAAFVNGESLVVDGGMTSVLSPAPASDDGFTHRYPFHPRR